MKPRWDWALALWVLFGCAAGGGLVAYFIPKDHTPVECVTAINLSAEIIYDYTGAIIDITKHDDLTSALAKVESAMELHDSYRDNSLVCKGEQ